MKIYRIKIGNYLYVQSILISAENRNKIKEVYPDIMFVMSNKPRYKIVLDKENI